MPWSSQALPSTIAQALLFPGRTQSEALDLVLDVTLTSLVTEPRMSRGLRIDFPSQFPECFLITNGQMEAHGRGQDADGVAAADGGTVDAKDDHHKDVSNDGRDAAGNEDRRLGDDQCLTVTVVEMETTSLRNTQAGSA